MENLNLFSVNDQLLNILDNTLQLSKKQEQALLTETGKLSIYYLKEICTKSNQRSVENNMHAMQHLLYWLLEKIYEKQQQSPSSFLENIAEQLCAFLQFLEKYGGKWFNRDAPMPHYVWLPIHKQLHPYIQKGKSCVLKQQADKLIQIVQQVYQSTTTKPTPTYQQAKYWQKLMEVLQDSSTQPNDNSANVICTLLQYNFNHSSFISYVFKSYLENTQLSSTSAFQWQQAFQQVNRIVPETGLKLFVNEENCKKQLLKLIRNEMNAEIPARNVEYLLPDKSPFQYNLTVAQLALFIRMQIDAGIMQTENLTEMLRHLSENTVTTRTSSIGIKSLYNNYHQPDRAALQIMMEYNTRIRIILKSLMDK